MKREYIPDSQWNKTGTSKNPRTGTTSYFVRGIIRIDGQEHSFFAQGKSEQEAKSRFDTFLNPECTCKNITDIPNCAIHKK